MEKRAVGQIIATFEAKFATISLKLGDIFWYYIFIVKIDSEHYIYNLSKKKDCSSYESLDPSIVPHAEITGLIDANAAFSHEQFADAEIYRIAN